jgi:integrase
VVAKTAFSDVGLRSIQPPKQGQVFYWDAKLPSFGVRVSQGGSKTFLVKHRNQFTTIGRFPILSLAEARLEARRLLAEFTLGKVRPQTITYEQAVRVFLSEKSHKKPRTVRDYERLLGRLNFTGQLSDITHGDVDRKLLRFTAQGEKNHIIVAGKVFFNWCIKRRYITDNPLSGHTQKVSPSRARVLTDSELKSIWRACSGVPNGNFENIVRLLILTGQRRSEIASLQTSWITTSSNTLHSKPVDNAGSSFAYGSHSNFSPSLWTLTIPASITKNGREHCFPLGLMASQLLENISTSRREASSTEPKTPLLFSARGKSSVPFNGWSKSKAALNKLSGVTGWTLHDLRRTYATNLARLGTPIHVVEKLLNHISGSHGGIVGVYQRHQYWEEQIVAVEKYDDFISNLIR